jgi:hypothetical protein
MELGAAVAIVLACALAISCPSARAQLSQQGPKLVETGAVGNASQGICVSVSADGNTAIVGGAGDNGGVGAAWVWRPHGAPADHHPAPRPNAVARSRLMVPKSIVARAVIWEELCPQPNRC